MRSEQEAIPGPKLTFVTFKDQGGNPNVGRMSAPDHASHLGRQPIARTNPAR